MIDPKAPCPLLTHEEAKQLNLLSSYTRSERAIIARAFRFPRYVLNEANFYVAIDPTYDAVYQGDYMNDDELIQFITEFTERCTYPPTQREIAGYFGISHTSIQYHLHRLQAEGRLTWQPNRPRTLIICQEAS